MTEALAQLPDYRGDAILEIEKGFLDDAIIGREYVLDIARRPQPVDMI